MRLVNFDFLKREGRPSQFPFGLPVRIRPKLEVRKSFEEFMSKRRKKKRVTKVFVSRGGIRI